MRHRAGRAVDHLGIDQSQNPAPFGVQRDHRVHEHADVAAVAHLAETPLAPSMAGEVQLRGVGDRQHMPPGRPPPRQPARLDQHLHARDRRVIEKVGEPAALGAAVRQRVQTHRLLPLYRPQKRGARGCQPAVPKPAKTRFVQRIHPPSSSGRANPLVTAPASRQFASGPDSTRQNLVGQDSGENDPHLPDHRSPLAGEVTKPPSAWTLRFRRWR